MSKQEILSYEVAHKHHVVFWHPFEEGDEINILTRGIMRIAGCNSIKEYNAIRKAQHEKHLSAWAEKNQGSFI